VRKPQLFINLSIQIQPQNGQEEDDVEVTKKRYVGRAPRNSDKIDLKAEFERIADGQGYLGTADGVLAYGYVRVSAEQQAEEGRTGLPRQILHLHEVALKGVTEKDIPPLKIPWDLLYADDGFSGFEFRNRPALNALLEEINDNKQSQFVVMEHIDRLSRQATWHQGYLLEQIEKAGCTPVFWKAYGSEIERSVMGAISEHGMKQEIQRMVDGQILKAKGGRITAKRPKFGYMFVDSKGNPQETPGRDTHYAPHPEHSRIMKWIYHALIYENKTINKIAQMMNEGTTPVWEGPVPTTFGGCVWHTATLCKMIKDPIYKGEYYAQRFASIKTGEFNEAGREKHRMIERPRDEWILIKVPPIVTPEEWALAQKRLKQNRKRSPRNTKQQNWLLTSMIRCARCGYIYGSIQGGTKRTRLRYYGCLSKYRERAKEDGTACEQRSYIRADVIEPVIWHTIVKVIVDPEVILDTIDADYDVKLAEYQNELAYIDQSLDKLQAEWERWNKAYGAEVIGLSELKEYRNDITRHRKELQVDRDELVGRIERIESIADRKAYARKILGLYREVVEKAGKEPPFELKRQILQTLVDTIWVNDQTMTARIDGVIRTTVDIMEIFSELQLNRRWRRCDWCQSH
jgi:site-specific DNA recombinase